MLILSRKRYETVIINVKGVLIEVGVSEIRGDRVRLGFSAPKEVQIHRKEIYDEMEKEKADAANRGTSYV